MIRLLCFFSLLLLSCNQDPADNPLLKIMQELKKDFPDLSENLEQYELQIRYTQIEQIGIDSIQLLSHQFQQDNQKYFYPASTVKMPICFLALDKLTEIQAQGYKITIDTPIQFSADSPPLTSFVIDSTAKNQRPTLRHLINRVFTVSDNNAYNRLYEFIGRDQINLALREKGLFEYSKIITRVGVAGYDHEANGKANAFNFYDENGILYGEPLKVSKMNYESNELTKTIKGKGYIDSMDSLVNIPFDMGMKNYFNLSDLEGVIQRVIYPQLFDESQRFQMKKKHYEFLRHAMARLPREQNYPVYNLEEYYDGYVKFFLYGDIKDSIPSHIRIFNKVGYAYGTLTDCAFVVDFKNELAFFLTATILVNENQIFNDGEYEYDSLGIPILAELGRKVHAYELSRKRTKLNLSDFNLVFGKKY